jgi:hypothetical protein
MMVTLPGQTFTSGSGNSGAVSAQTAGTSFNVTLTLVDTNNNQVTSYSGTKTISYSGPASSPGGTAPSYTASVTFTSGQGALLAARLYDAQTTTITATDGMYPGVASSSLTVNPASANKLAMEIEPSSSVSAGGTFSTAPAVYIEDQYDNVLTGDNSSTVTAAVQTGTGPLTGTLTVTASSGVATFSALAAPTLAQTGLELQFTDAGDSLSALSDSTGITVNAGSATQMIVTLPNQTFTGGSGNSGTAAGQAAGTAFTITKLTAVDSYNNIATTYSGSKTISYSGPANSPSGSAPAYTTAVSFTSGQSTTPLTTTLKDAQTTTITATDGALTGVASSSLSVSSTGAQAAYRISAASTTLTAGANDALTITAVDTYGNTVTSVSGDKSLTFSGLGTSPGGTVPTVTGKTGSAINEGTATTITFSGGLNSAGGTLVACKAEGPVTLAATDGTDSTASSGGAGVSLTTSASTTSKLAFAVQPSTTAADSAISPAVVVNVGDQ